MGFAKHPRDKKLLTTFVCGGDGSTWGRGVMSGARGNHRKSSLSRWKRRLLGAVALGALPLPGGVSSPEPAWAQISETLPEVTVSAPRTTPRAPRRTESTARRATRAPSEVSEPAPTATPSALPAFQVIAPTPITGLGFDPNKVPSMVQTVTSEDFSRVYSPNVVETLQ